VYFVYSYAKKSDYSISEKEKTLAMVFKVWVFWTIINITLNHPINQLAIKNIERECNSNFQIDTVVSSDTIDGPYTTIVGITFTTPVNETALCIEQVLNYRMEQYIRAITVMQK